MLVDSPEMGTLTYKNVSGGQNGTILRLSLKIEGRHKPKGIFKMEKMTRPWVAL